MKTLDNTCLDFYPIDALSQWLTKPPLCVIEDIGSHALTIATDLALSAGFTKDHPNIDVVNTFDPPSQPTLKQILQEIYNYYNQLQHISVTARQFRYMCKLNKAKIRYENNAQTDLEFDIANKHFHDLRQVVEDWQVCPSPLAVLYTMCTGITAICNQIQSLVIPIIQHPMFKVEKRLDRHEHWTFVRSMEETYKNAEKLKCWVSFGMLYREAFLQGQIHFSSEELLKADKYSS